MVSDSEPSPPACEETGSPNKPWSVLAARPRKPRHLSVIMLAVALALLVLTAGRNTSLTSVQVTVDGESQQVHTHQRTVGSLLRSLDIHWDDADIVIPDPATRLGEGMEVKVLRARRAWVQADGRAFPLATHARTPAEVLRECGLEVGPSDQARVNGKPWSLEAPLPPSESPSDPLRVALRRAVSIEVEMDGVRTTLLTAALTVGEALRQEGISLYLGDLVRPGLGTPVTSGLKVFVERSLPVQIQVDGRTVDTRTRQDTVGQVLAEEGIHLAGRDYVSLPLDSLVHPNLRIRVVRVKEVPAIEQESIPYETLWRPNSELELDQQRVEQAGEPGLIKRRYRAAYEDGELKARTLEETWVDREPITRLIAYGTKIVSRPLETPEGTVTYWRKVRMLATSYTAATAGKDEDHPEYGITYLGWAMKKGIVAVDPTVIPLRSRVYVPGYGVGVAGDTGGSIKGRRIDLGYDKDNLVLWYRWVDVYLLDPPPPRSQIRWVLPNWPTERK